MQQQNEAADPRVVAFDAAYHDFIDPYRRLVKARVRFWVPYDMLMRFSSFSPEQCEANPQYAEFNTINERARPLCLRVWQTLQPFRMAELLEMSRHNNTRPLPQRRLLEYVIDNRLTRIYDVMYDKMRPLFQQHDYARLARYDIQGILQEFNDFLAHPSPHVSHSPDLITRIIHEHLLQYAEAVATWRARVNDDEGHRPIMSLMSSLPPDLRTHIAHQALSLPLYEHTTNTFNAPLPSPFEPLL